MVSIYKRPFVSYFSLYPHRGRCPRPCRRYQLGGMIASTAAHLQSVPLPIHVAASSPASILVGPGRVELRRGCRVRPYEDVFVAITNTCTRASCINLHGGNGGRPQDSKSPRPSQGWSELRNETTRWSWRLWRSGRGRFAPGAVSSLDFGWQPGGARLASARWR